MAKGNENGMVEVTTEYKMTYGSKRDPSTGARLKTCKLVMEFEPDEDSVVGLTRMMGEAVKVSIQRKQLKIL